MDSRNKPLPQALVLRWNDYKLRVKCPFCPYSHGHAFARPSSEHGVDRTKQGWQFLLPSRLRIRRSDCDWEEGESHYTFVFPASDEAAKFSCGWELDRENQSFVAVNSQGVVPVPVDDRLDGRTLLPQYEAQHKPAPAVDDLATRTENLELDPDDGEEEPPTHSPIPTPEDILQELYEDPDYRRKMYVSHCCYCELQDLVSLYRKHPNDHLIGSVDEYGNTGLLFAASEEKGLHVVKWLSENGGSQTHANHYGRTPLMEAALWGRLATVRYFIREDIDIDARDANGMRAIDLSDDTARNTKERNVRSGRVYREAADASQLRKRIHALLQRTASSSSNSSIAGTAIAPQSQRRAFFDRRPDGSLEILRPRESVRPPAGKLEKAFATLDRGPNYPYVSAMSGFTQTGWPNVLDNEEWTTKAEGLQALLGLPKNRAFASHVEPQLLAYLLDRHSLIKWDTWLDHDLSKLDSVIPDHSIRPVITISMSYICSSCTTFIERFCRVFPGFRVDFHCVGDTTAPPLKSLFI